MDFGVHLSTMAFGEQTFSLAELVRFAETAEHLGFTTLCANDQRQLIALMPADHRWPGSCNVERPDSPSSPPHAQRPTFHSSEAA